MFSTRILIYILSSCSFWHKQTYSGRPRLLRHITSQSRLITPQKVKHLCLKFLLVFNYSVCHLVVINDIGGEWSTQYTSLKSRDSEQSSSSTEFWAQWNDSRAPKTLCYRSYLPDDKFYRQDLRKVPNYVDFAPKICIWQNKITFASMTGYYWRRPI